MPYWFDGNNLMGLSVTRARADHETRRAFLNTLGGYASAKGGKFTVYFDGDETERICPPGGVQIRYSAPKSADVAILARLQEIRCPHEVIVVTNDRSLQMHCRNAGAKWIVWAEFLARMSSGSPRKGAARGKEESVDVEEWARFFGLKKDSLN